MGFVCSECSICTSHVMTGHTLAPSCSRLFVQLLAGGASVAGLSTWQNPVLVTPQQQLDVCRPVGIYVFVVMKYILVCVKRKKKKKKKKKKKSTCVDTTA